MILSNQRKDSRVDHILFLTTRAGWKVTKVYSHYTFEQDSFKKDFVLGNQSARQEAVTKRDDVQGNFYKLMNNSNFSFDCQDNSKNGRLQLIYDEQAEVEFIEKYDSKGKINCFLSEEHLMKKCNDKYDQMMEDEDPID